MTVRAQPYRLDPPANAETLPQIVTNADEMFQMLFEELFALDASLTALSASSAASGVTRAQVAANVSLRVL